ncbi:hypothetical protein FFJ24_021255 [Pedobacter sp. KBS0701]|uniref:hypothetical protein n=1 Tax=Pedobacter sp. KBS0701 TaxID=2578106 RepID=UPI00110E6C5D|nr:hypothetical protein [Pedobacter sp. KBS0701]QDW27216.1 hypothetical protein FFJ24_021255 [Pedobacter sp. KBS0701]
MSILTLITLDFEDYKVLEIPHVIHLKVGSRLKVVIRRIQPFMDLNRYFNTTVGMYFEGNSPFGDKLVHEVSLDKNIRSEGAEIVLFEGTAERPGEYKYGINVIDRGSVRFDEDPYIIVY